MQPSTSSLRRIRNATLKAFRRSSQTIEAQNEETVQSRKKPFTLGMNSSISVTLIVTSMPASTECAQRTTHTRSTRAPARADWGLEQHPTRRGGHRHAQRCTHSKLLGTRATPNTPHERPKQAAVDTRLNKGNRNYAPAACHWAVTSGVSDAVVETITTTLR